MRRVEDAAFVVPFFNEAEVIGSVVKDLLTHGAHVVLVNDGSTDGSHDEILNAGAFLVNHPLDMGRARPCRPASSSPGCCPGSAAS